MFRVRLQASATLDDKGRLALPAQLKRALGDRGLYKMVWMVHRGAIWGYTLEDFDAIETQWGDRDPFEPEVLQFTHAVLATAQDVEIDRQGRVHIPPMLRKLAGLDKSVVITSVLNRIEVWDSERWEARYLQAVTGLEQSGGAS
ncbi:MAG: cell division/cell wall cluster transcriptional repressor MraZ [Deltaproteobacteria bacterium]|nr:cell division/cell wall cluster transcriptional repressor MraZ [Deltaproteobacteria bacterium]